MRMLIVCVRDAKAELFNRPFYVHQEGQAIRAFSDEVNRQENENQLYNHPGDFALYSIGYFDDNEGKLFALDIPKLLIQGDQVKNK